MQALSFCCWFFLFCIPLLNNLAPKNDDWIALCTQKGIQLISVAQAGEKTSSVHENTSCPCNSESLPYPPDQALADHYRPSQVAADYYSFKPWLSAYQFKPPRAPPIS